MLATLENSSNGAITLLMNALLKLIKGATMSPTKSNSFANSLTELAASLMKPSKFLIDPTTSGDLVIKKPISSKRSPKVLDSCSVAPANVLT